MGQCICVFRVGVRAQTAPLEQARDAPRDERRHAGDLGIVGRREGPKARRCACVHAVERQRVEVHVEVERAPGALDERYRPPLRFPARHTRSSAERRTCHERRVSVISGHHVQRRQRGDVACQGVAQRVCFQGFPPSSERTTVFPWGGSPQRQHASNGPKARGFKTIARSHFTGCLTTWRSAASGGHVLSKESKRSAARRLQRPVRQPTSRRQLGNAGDGKIRRSHQKT